MRHRVSLVVGAVGAWCPRGNVLIGALAVLGTVLVRPCPGTPTVEARLEKTVVGVGETLGLTITVTGSADVEVRATVPQVEGLRIEGPQTSRMSQVTIINGRQESSVHTTLTYRITALRAGQFTIPAFPVEVDGTTRQVGPLGLRAERGSQASAIRLRCTVDDRSPFVQQPVTYRVTWLVANEIHAYELTIPVLDGGDELVVEFMPPRGASRTQELMVNGVPMGAAVGKETVEGADYTTFTVTARIYPLKEGALTLPAPIVRASVQQGWEVVRDFFFMERRPKLVTMTAVGDQVRLSVRGLPVEGRPRGFGGAVGSYELAISASDTVVRVGDPILLTIRIKGSGLLSQVRRPDLGAVPEVARDFAVLGTLDPGEVSGNEMVFRETVRPKSAEVRRFPPVPFSYFDPSTQRYRTAWSSPIPLRVSPAPPVGPLETFGAREEAGRRPTEAVGGLRAPSRGEALLSPARDPWAPLVRVLAAPLAYGVLVGTMAIRRHLTRNRALWARRGAMLGLERGLSRVGRIADDDAFFAAVAELCAHQVAARLGISPAEVTPHDIPRLVAEGVLAQEGADQLQGLLEEIDRARFSPRPSDPQARAALVSRARKVLSSVRRA